MMNQEDLFKKIGTILNELQDQYEYLAQNSKKINELELELFFANASFLTDHVQILQKVNRNEPLISVPEHPEEQSLEVSASIAAAEPFIAPVAAPVVEPLSSTPIAVESLVSAPPITEPKPVPVPELVAQTVDPHVMPGEEPVAETPVQDFKMEMEKEIFKLDDHTASFEFILNDKPSIDKFEFEEKPVTAIFDRPLSVEEQKIIEEKKKMQVHLGGDIFARHDVQDEELLYGESSEDDVLNPADEVGPEPFLVVKESTFIPEVNQVSFTSELKKTFPISEIRESEAAAKPTLNDILAGNMGLNKGLVSEHRKSPISDLKQAITLNQKLLFVKDLFNGYSLAYAEAIDLLNKMTDFKAADAFLQKNYSVKNNWSEKQVTTDQFYDLLHQRFPEDQ